jgi:sec-independent protein translocase protein TatA
VGTQEILIILVVILLLFGASKLPALARSAGQSLRIFKSEMSEMKKDGSQPAAPSAPIEAAPVDNIDTRSTPSVDEGHKNQA